MDTQKSLPTSARVASAPLARSLRWARVLAGFSVGLALCLGAAAPAQAADGCLALLCLAAPSWSSIEQCVATVEAVLNDLAHGKPFPSCDTAGTGNTATLKWADAPTFCPPQYTSRTDLESSTAYQCQFAGAVEVEVDGQLWSRTWWNAGDSVTEFSDAAKAQLGTWNLRFDIDYAAWLASQPAAPVPSCTAC